MLLCAMLAVALSGCTENDQAQAPIGPENGSAGRPLVSGSPDGPAAPPADAPPMSVGVPMGHYQYESLGWRSGVNGDQGGVVGNDLCNLPGRFPPELAGVWFDRFDVHPESIGNPFALVIDGHPLPVHWLRLHFLDADEQPLAGPYEQHKIVPDGAVTGVVWTCISGPARAAYVSGPDLSGQLVVARWSSGQATCSETGGPVNEADGVWFRRFNVNQSLIGDPYIVEVPYPQVPVFTPPMFTFFDPAGRPLAQGDVMLRDGVMHEHGTVPAGAAWATFTSCHDGDMHGTFRAGPMAMPPARMEA